MSIEASAQQRAQLGRDLVPAQCPRRHCECEVLPCVHIERLLGQQPVLTQKHKARRQSHPFVAINKRMIAAKIEKVGGKIDGKRGNKWKVEK